MNKAFIGGAIAKDIKVSTGNGNIIVNFTVATKDSKDDKVENHDCVAFKDNAQKCQDLKIGDIVYLEGKFTTSVWEYQGKPRSKKQIIAFKVEIVKRKNGVQSQNQPQQPPQQPRKPIPPPPPPPEENYDNVISPDFSGEDDIPF